MFGHDGNGNEVIEPEDGTIDAVGIAAAIDEHLFADAFVSTKLRDVPVVAKWVQAIQQALNCRRSRSVLRLSKLRFGPAQSVVKKALSTPLSQRCAFKPSAISSSPTPPMKIHWP
jgi:hypothetical protein